MATFWDNIVNKVTSLPVPQTKTPTSTIPPLVANPKNKTTVSKTVPSSKIPPLVAAPKEPSFWDKIIQPVVDKVQSSSKVSTPTPYKPLPNPENKWQNLTDLAQGPSLALSKFIVEPAYKMGASVYELKTGKQAPKLTIPAFTKNMGNFVDAQSYQKTYEDKIASGMDEKKAYQSTFFEGLNDAIMLAEPVKGGVKFGISKVAPEAFLNKSITNISKEAMTDYFSGRKTAEQVGFTPEIKKTITEKMKTMTTQEKSLRLHLLKNA